MTAIRTIIISCHCSLQMNTNVHHPPSKGELLKWLNKRLPTVGVDKIEQLGNGVPFLLLMNILHPGCIKTNKINFNATLDYENMANFKLLAAAFAEKEIKYYVDVIRLAARKYQDNLMLLQFMHKLVTQAGVAASNQEANKTEGISNGGISNGGISGGGVSNSIISPKDQNTSNQNTLHQNTSNQNTSNQNTFNQNSLNPPSNPASTSLQKEEDPIVSHIPKPKLKPPMVFKKIPLTKSPPPDEGLQFSYKGINPHKKTLIRAQHVFDQKLDDHVKLEKLKRILLGGTHYAMGESRGKSQNFTKVLEQIEFKDQTKKHEIINPNTNQNVINLIEIQNITEINENGPANNTLDEPLLTDNVEIENKPASNQKEVDMFDKLRRQFPGFASRSKILNANFNNPISPPTPISQRLSELPPLDTSKQQSQVKNEENVFATSNLKSNQKSTVKSMVKSIQKEEQPQVVILLNSYKETHISQEKEELLAAYEREMTSAAKSEMQNLLSDIGEQDKHNESEAEQATAL